jgi:adenylate cyclase
MKQLFKKVIWEWRGVWMTAPTVTGVVILLRFAGFLQGWEWAVYDQYMRLPPQASPDPRIVIVGINETDVQALETADIYDQTYAQLITKLKAKNPRAIGLDVYRDLPQEPGHQALVDLFKSTPNLVAIQKVVGEQEREVIPPPPSLVGNKAQVGANDLLIDADNRVRRGFLSVSDPQQGEVYSFALLLALHYLEKESISLDIAAGTDNWWKLDSTVFKPFQANDGGYVKAETGGYQMLIHYRGGSQYFSTVSLTDVLEDRVPKDWGNNQIILIGKVGESFKDLFFTPYSSHLLSLPEPMAGVEIHANITSQILSAVLDNRPLMKSWSEPLEWLWILVWSGAGAVLTWRWRYAGGVNQFSWQKIASPFIAGTLLLGSTYFAFLGGWWVPVVPPFLALAGSAIVIIGYVARTAGDIRRTFGRYLTDEVVATLLENPQGLQLGGERRKITILTSDLRGFTALSERLPPEEVVKILNFYLGAMADVITDYQGTIDEFMGDGILVLFGAPTEREDDAQRAVACAVAMQLAMQNVNETIKKWGLPALEMGIGINTGEVVVGNIGSEKRTKYGIVGSQVNLTYRIESYTTGGQILVSESTFSTVHSLVQVESQRQVSPKGVKEPITIYEIGGVGGKYQLFLPKAVEIFLDLLEPIFVEYTVLQEKDVTHQKQTAKIVQLSAKGAQLCCENADNLVPPPLSNIKLNLLLNQQWSEDVYAKVLEKTANSHCFYIYFTAKPPTVAAQIETLYQAISANSH